MEKNKINFYQSYKDFAEDETGFDLSYFKVSFMRYTAENRRRAEAARLNRYLLYAVLFFILACASLLYNAYRYSADISRNLQIKEIARQIVVPAVNPPATSSEVNDAKAAAPANSGQGGVSSADEINPAIQSLRDEFQNDDIVAYLNIPGTSIGYPVLQCGDNEFYLERDIYKNANAAGSIFLDFENDSLFCDRHSIIYGHNMRDGSMFHNLRYYEDEDFFKEYGLIELVTLEGVTTWRAYAFFETSTDFYYIQTNFSSEEEAEALFRKMAGMSLHSTEPPLEAGQNILTLSTCTNRTGDTRFVLSAVQIN